MTAQQLVAALIVQQQTILLGRRSPARAFYPNVWDIFGGHMEPGEGPEQTLLRELEEELGITPTEWRHVETVVEPDAEHDAELHCHVYWVLAWNGTPRNRQPEEHATIGWFALDEAVQLDLAHPAYPRLFATVLGGVSAGYDAVAEEYAAKFFDELAHKPFDRKLLDRFAAQVRHIGPVCDLGCGPGQIARYLHEWGADAFGVDLSPAMVEVARRLNPGLRFEQGDILALPAADQSWGGIAAFYSLIHIPRQQMPAALQEMHRVLRPGGLLLLSYHIGDETVHLDRWYDKPVSLDFHFFRPHELQAYLHQAGFTLLENLQRPPYEAIEHPSRRGYILAQRRSS